jgi:ferric-dicitrate binding protein FerR (iron transport regulator)
LAAAAVLVLAVVSVRLLDRPSSVDPVGGLAQVKLVLGGSNVRPGTTVEASSWVTTEDDGLVALELDGRSIRLAPDSRARILEPDELELGRGAVYVDSGASAGAGIAVLTSSGRVTELGTRFEVRLEPTALRVRVRDGRVAVDDGTRRNEAGEGIELTLHDSGEVSDRDIDVFGPEWEWTMRAAPAPAIEGRPLGELLGWVESESGYPVVFRDAASERRARETVLHGDVDGLAPLEALAATLATSGLTHRLESGRLVLEAEQGDAMQ